MQKSSNNQLAVVKEAVSAIGHDTNVTDTMTAMWKTYKLQKSTGGGKNKFSPLVASSLLP